MQQPSKLTVPAVQASPTVNVSSCSCANTEVEIDPGPNTKNISVRDPVSAKISLNLLAPEKIEGMKVTSCMCCCSEPHVGQSEVSGEIVQNPAHIERGCCTNPVESKITDGIRSLDSANKETISGEEMALGEEWAEIFR
jgi:hypothetical protein